MGGNFCGRKSGGKLGGASYNNGNYDRLSLNNNGGARANSIEVGSEVSNSIVACANNGNGSGVAYRTRGHGKGVLLATF